MMPLYEYVCPRCGEKREVLARSADAAAPACPQCGATMDKGWAPVAAVGKTSGSGCVPRSGFS